VKQTAGARTTGTLPATSLARCSAMLSPQVLPSLLDQGGKGESGLQHEGGPTRGGRELLGAGSESE
jgi:hypothetical protein